MRHTGMWVLGLLLGALASAGTAQLAPPGPGGWSAFGFVVLSWLVFAFVAVSVVTALERLFPLARPHVVASRHHRR